MPTTSISKNSVRAVSLDVKLACSARPIIDTPSGKDRHLLTTACHEQYGPPLKEKQDTNQNDDQYHAEVSDATAVLGLWDQNLEEKSREPCSTLKAAAEAAVSTTNASPHAC